MENRAHALAAGLFAIMLGAGIVFAIWWFSDQRVPMRELVLEARGDINGLGEQSRVRYRGMAAGRVRAIGIDPADLRFTPTNHFADVAEPDLGELAKHHLLGDLRSALQRLPPAASSRSARCWRIPGPTTRCAPSP